MNIMMVACKKYGVILIFVFVALSIGIVCAEKLDIEIKNDYSPGQSIEFRFLLYDDYGAMAEGFIDYVIQNYYTDVVESGGINAWEKKTFIISTDAVQGHWRVIAEYNGIKTERIFNVGELEKAEIKIEGNELILKNIGNSVYDKQVSIFIGDVAQTALIYLEIGQEKRIRLTAPDGNYNIRVSDGTEEKVFENVGLTGNVVGLERVTDRGFFRKYPLVTLFLGFLIVLVIIVAMLKLNKEN